MTAMLTPSVGVVPVWKELLPDDVTPLSKTWTRCSGPERPSLPTKARWTAPNVPCALHGLLFLLLQVRPFHVPEVCSQLHSSATV